MLRTLPLCLPAPMVVDTLVSVGVVVAVSTDPMVISVRSSWCF